jgi:RNA polymerase sigma factor (sigma-70 family)
MTSPPTTTYPLSLFDNDSVVAEKRYAALRARLIKYFEWRHADGAEDLADEVLFRSFRRLKDGVTVKTSIEQYVYGVARLVYMETRRVQRHDVVPVDEDLPLYASERTHESIEAAITVGQLQSMLSEEDFLLLKRYYVADSRELAAELGVPPGVVRVRVHRIIEKLRRRMREQAR